MITAKGTLIHGIEVDGVVHKDFELRAATIGDAVAAIEEAGPDASFLRVKIHKMARCLLRVGTLKEGEITPEMLMALPEDEFAVLNAAIGETEKKPNASESASSPTAS